MVFYKNFRIVWKHKQFKQSLDFTAMTTCYFFDRATNELLYGEVAVCSPKDMFNKETGRKVSLKKIMKALELDKQTRTEIWEAYHNREGKATKRAQNKTLNYYYQLMDGDSCEGLFASNVDYEITAKVVRMWRKHYNMEDFEEWFEENYSELDLPTGTVISRIFVEEINV